MVLAGLLVTGADVLIALGVASNSAQRSAKRAALEQHGVLAFARITGMAETGTSINDQPVVKLALQMEILQILKASNIALDGPLDLRSNPALRHRVQDAVRRAAAAQSSPAQSSPAQPSPARRMQELNSLRAMEAISDEEYAEKRRRIISEI
jgi:hypothetical protein